MLLYLICCCILYVVVSYMLLYLICFCILYVAVSYTFLYIICCCIFYVVLYVLYVVLYPPPYSQSGHLLCTLFSVPGVKQLLTLEMVIPPHLRNASRYTFLWTNYLDFQVCLQFSSYCLCFLPSYVERLKFTDVMGTLSL